MTDLTIQPLTTVTWPSFADLAARNNGVWNGCWCTSFHPRDAHKGTGPEASCAYKQQLVEAGRAHAAMVFDGDTAVGWCQYGSPEELPSISHRKEYEAHLDALPDYRITCFFIEKGHRRQGVAAIALGGALELISGAGGGVVEAYPYDTNVKRISASFLYNGTRSLFENAGFTYQRRKGKNHCVMRTTVPATPPPR